MPQKFLGILDCLTFFFFPIFDMYLIHKKKFLKTFKINQKSTFEPFFIDAESINSLASTKTFETIFKKLYNKVKV